MTNDYSLPAIPAYITVHMASPYEDGENITLSFPDYIKGVASATLDGNMPEQAMIAVIYAQITYALSRINSRYYRSMRFSFDITNNENFDQPFVYNGVVYENINKIVDNIFTEYISYNGSNQPIDAKVCYGGVLMCRGLS